MYFRKKMVTIFFSLCYHINFKIVIVFGYILINLETWRMFFWWKMSPNSQIILTQDNVSWKMLHRLIDNERNISSLYEVCEIMSQNRNNAAKSVPLYLTQKKLCSNKTCYHLSFQPRRQRTQKNVIDNLIITFIDWIRKPSPNE